LQRNSGASADPPQPGTRGGRDLSRLIVVSNRVADPAKSARAGGLAVALLEALRANGGLWFGWDGKTVADAQSAKVSETTYENISIATMSLSEKDYHDYYHSYSNSVLWPVFHNRLDLATISSEAVGGYRRVNQSFAHALSTLVKPGDLIWIHDYHLIPLAAELRRLGCQNRIGFYLHIPFPSPDVFAAAPEHEWLMRCLLAYDLVGFQTNSDVENFERSLRELESKVHQEKWAKDWPAFSGTVAAFPIGIDVDAFAAMARTDEADARIRQLNRHASARIHIIGVDRLDYTKGLPERLRAFRRLLELYPENQKVATLMQIAPPTREDVDAYADIRHELEALSGAINGEFGDFDWTPVRYVHRVVPRDTLAALFRGSHVGLVTPLRDGMNLVAKEYVAAQDEEKPGVLVLSRFAGAAEDLVEALIVNPYDPDEVARALQQAIKMPLPERRERNAALLQRIRKRNVKHWREGYLAMLAGNKAYADPV
jgi:trehalose 6-phosphate synthase